jgi:transcription elongation factor GreA
MKLKRIPITEEGFKNLKQELDSLKKDRPNAVKNLSEARNLGDLSENGLYTAAKAKLRSIDSQIFRIEMQIKLADVTDSKTTDAVRIGSKVEVSKEGKSEIYHVVGDFEADPRERKISRHSPLGRAIINKRVGDTVLLEAPSGKIQYKVLKIF